MKVWLWVAWILVFSASSSSARDILVDNVSGDDRASGSVWTGTQDLSGPVRTIGRALQRALPGDRIVLAKTAEPYREAISIVGSQHSGWSTTPFSIVGAGAILDGSMPVPPDAWTHYQKAVFRFRPTLVGYQALFLRDRPVPQVVVARGNQGLPKLEPLQWCLFEGSIYFCVEAGKLPQDYPLSYAQKETGITLYHCRNVVVMDLVVQGFRIDGIQAANSARDVRLVGVTSRANGRAGVTVGGASTVDLEGCLVGNNAEAQLLTLPYSQTHLRTTLLPNLTAPAWVDRGGRLFFAGKILSGGRDLLEEPAAPAPKE